MFIGDGTGCGDKILHGFGYKPTDEDRWKVVEFVHKRNDPDPNYPAGVFLYAVVGDYSADAWEDFFTSLKFTLIGKQHNSNDFEYYKLHAWGLCSVDHADFYKEEFKKLSAEKKVRDSFLRAVKKRGNSTTDSNLIALCKKFRTIEALEKATKEEISDIIGNYSATRVYNKLHP